MKSSTYPLRTILKPLIYYVYHDIINNVIDLLLLYYNFIIKLITLHNDSLRLLGKLSLWALVLYSLISTNLLLFLLTLFYVASTSGLLATSDWYILWKRFTMTSIFVDNGILDMLNLFCMAVSILLHWSD